MADAIRLIDVRECAPGDGGDRRSSFDARDARDAGVPAIDLVHLRRYTMGDVVLEAEVLELFQGQAGSVADQLEAAREQADWHMATHSIKGSARAVGAWAVARVAEQMEPLDPASGRARELMDVLRHRLAETARFITAYRSANA